MTSEGFRNWITADGSSGFKAEAGRYHLYVAYFCPFASRAIIARKLKGLEAVISMDVVHWHARQDGFHFIPTEDGICTPDTVNGKSTLKEVYKQAAPEYPGKFSVPLLWDKKTGQIVSGESAEILRMFNSEFNEFSATDHQRELNLYPETLRPEINALNAWIAPEFNLGVYRCGFAKEQAVYDEGARVVFGALDKLEAILSKKRYLTGNTLTEADVRLFTTLVRFDTVYHGLFKLNKKRIIDYPNLWGYVRDVYQIPGVKDTVNQEHIQKGYQLAENALGSLNPVKIVAIGPDLDWDAPHGRENVA